MDNSELMQILSALIDMRKKLHPDAIDLRKKTLSPNVIDLRRKELPSNVQILLPKK